MEKKGQVDLTGLAISIIVIGIIAAVGASILITYANSRVTELGTYAVQGEDLVATPCENGGTTLASTWVQGMQGDSVTNSTDYISSGNYTLTVNSGNGVGTLVNTTDFCGQWTANYTVYNTSETEFNVAQQASIGIGEYGNWYKILVIVGIAAVVLGLIFMAFGKKGEGATVAY